MEHEILLIYQDCPMCGARKDWGETQTVVAETYGLKYRAIPFTSAELGDLTMRAIETGIKSYPFFTDGERFSKQLKDFADVIPTETNTDEDTVKKAGKKTRRKKTEAR